MKPMKASRLFVIFWAIVFGAGCQRQESRGPFMRVVESELRSYARNNDGQFPDGTNSFEALAKLFPDYSHTGAELAGLSGDIQAVTSALQSRRSISNLTGWVYVPGLREDDDIRLRSEE